MKRVLILTIIAVAVVVGFWIFATANKQGNGLEKVSIRLKWLHQAQFAGFYFADKAGYYRDNGLDITLNPGGVDFPAIQLVASGSDQFGVASFEQIMIARSKGIPVVAVANIYRQTPLIIFSFAEKNIKKPQDLIGKKVAITLDPDEQLVYQSILKNAGVDRKKIDEEIFKYDPSLLTTGKVDAMLDYSISKPLSIEKETGEKLNRIYPSDYGVHFYADTLFTTDSIVKNNPELVRKVVAATIKGYEDAIANQDQAVAYTLEYDSQLNRAHQANMLRESEKFIYPSNEKSLLVGFMDKNVVESTQQFLLEKKYIDKPLTLTDVFTNDFLPK